MHQHLHTRADKCRIPPCQRNKGKQELICVRLTQKLLRIPAITPATGDSFMKKYLSLAALLGIIAIVSVSYLAQAQNEMLRAQTAVEKPAEEAAGIALEPAETLEESDESAAGDAEDDVSPEVARFMESVDACQTKLATESDIDFTQKEYDAAFTACMTARGHSAEELKTRYFDNQPVLPDVDDAE
jgi:hypothetical protein